MDEDGDPSGLMLKVLCCEPHLVNYKHKHSPAMTVDVPADAVSGTLSMSTANWLAGEFAHSYAWLKSRLHRKIGSLADSEDIAATSFVELALVKNSSEIKSPRAMLSVIASRLTYEMWRRRDLERAFLDALAAQDIAVAPSAEDITAIAQELAAIDRALAGLPPKVKHAFLLSQLDGFTHADIAAQLGVSTRMVRNYLTTAIQQFYLAI
jgi:RNA polymerase sigma-70 factor (ECF subfamily)